MKTKIKTVLISALSAIICLCAAMAFNFAFSAKAAAYADEETLTNTKYMISKNGNYMILATAFNTSYLKENTGYVFGYEVTCEEDYQDIYSSTYYEGITLKSGDGFVSYAPEDIFGEYYSAEAGYVLIVEEIEYVPGKSYSYRAYIEDEEHNFAYGKNYVDQIKYKVTFDFADGSETLTRFVKGGAPMAAPQAPEKEGYALTSWQAGETEFDFTANVTGNLDLVATWKLLPTIAQTGADYKIDMYNDVTFAVTLNDFDDEDITSVTYGETALTGDDYSYDTENNELTLKGYCLNNIYRFGQSEYSFKLNLGNCYAEFETEYDHPENRVLNAGFETGTLYGWNAYQIWKGESGMMAWTNDRVVNGTYFDGNQYYRDGNYNLGIFGGSIGKDSGQERMGHLRSAPFTVAGSGWISFKMGGGRAPQFAYVSVRRSTDNVEVARFGNRHFNNKDVARETDAGVNNAEAYLFQYYYDLSAYDGESLYFVISDTSSHNWCDRTR